MDMKDEREREGGRYKREGKEEKRGRQMEEKGKRRTILAPGSTSSKS